MATIAAPVVGNIVLIGGGATDVQIGADENGLYLLSITVDGITYTYDPTGDGSITASEEHLFDFDIATQTLTVETDAGGSFAIVMTTGAFVYTPPVGQDEMLIENIGYAVVDFDGDVVGNTVTITLNVARPPIVRDDNIITNITDDGAAIAIPDFALLFNDTDPDGQAIEITAAGSADDGSVLTSGSPIDTVTFTDNGDGDGGTFEYTGTSNGDTDTGLVTIDRVQDNQDTLDGTQLGEILIGRDAAADTILGYDGGDVLIGQGGNDSLDGGAGSDTASYEGSSAAVNVNLGAGTASGGDAASDTLTSIENLIGSDHDDSLTGDGNDNVLTGGAGEDELTGGGGADTFVYTGDDLVGDDVITDFVSLSDNIDLDALFDALGVDTGDRGVVETATDAGDGDGENDTLVTLTDGGVAIPDFSITVIDLLPGAIADSDIDEGSL